MEPGQAPGVCHKWDKVTLHLSSAEDLTVKRGNVAELFICSSILGETF